MKLKLMALLLAGWTSVPFAPAIAQTAEPQVVASERANSPQRPIEFAQAPAPGAALAVMMQGAKLPAGVGLEPANASAIEAAITAQGFKGEAGDELLLRGIASVPAVVLVGRGEGPQQLREAGGRAAQALRSVRAPVAVLGLSDASDMAEAAFGYALGQYRFDRYKSAATPPPADRVQFVGAQAPAARTEWDARKAHLSAAVALTRDLQSEPANSLHPGSFVARTRAAFAGVPGVTVEVLDDAALRRLGMGAIVGVAQGSPHGARLMLVRYRGAEGAPLALVGKGITFDSGGLALKPNPGMWQMKADMSGAAAVMGAALSLARSRAPVHVVAVAALAENMPGSTAQRPGDVVRTFGGQTIEIRSADAEGRLVLADAIQYTIDRYRPFALVDIATLTGAASAALGSEFAGLFAREDAVAGRLSGAAAQSGEAVWRMPLHPAYAKAIVSDIADIKNSDATGAPGASAGAHFVGHFVPENVSWAHLDIAGVYWRDSDRPLEPKGASGFGVRLLDTLARSWQAP